MKRHSILLLFLVAVVGLAVSAVAAFDVGNQVVLAPDQVLRVMCDTGAPFTHYQNESVILRCDDIPTEWNNGPLTPVIATPLPTATNTATPTAVPTATETNTPTSTATATETPQPTATNTPTPTATPIPDVFNGGCFDPSVSTGTIKNAHFIGDQSLADNHIGIDESVGADGARYFAVPVEWGKRLTPPGGDTGIEWCFIVGKPGNYDILGTFRSPGAHNHDSFFASLDNGDSERMDVRSDAYPESFAAFESVFLNTGVHSIRFMHRESLTRIYGVRVVESGENVGPVIPTPTAVRPAPYPYPQPTTAGGYP